MTLDEIVKRGKTARSGGRAISRRGRSRGRGHGPNGFLGGGRGIGPARRGPLAVKNRPSSFSVNKASFKIWDLLCVMIGNLSFCGIKSFALRLKKMPKHMLNHAKTKQWEKRFSCTCIVKPSV